jgi:hypothetical protein
MKDFKVYLGIATLLLLLYIAFEYNKPKPVNWQPTLYYGDKIPFGTYILYHQLGDIFPGAKVTNTNMSLYSAFKNSGLQAGNYLIISKSITTTRSDFNAMTQYMTDGGSIFISASDWGGFLADTLKIEIKNQFNKRTKINFANSQLHNASDYKFDKGIGINYFSNFDTTQATVISKNSYGKSTMLSFNYGKGKLLLCANPEIFTNYSLLNSKNADYAAKALSYLPVKQNIYWDEFQNHDIIEEESPMRVFFKYPALQWAYYISLLGLVLFVLYEAKRRQRIIPVIEPLKNSSLEFVNVVGQVYYEKRDNANMAFKKITFLFSYLRDKYYIKTGKLDSDFITSLSNKTGVEPAFARELVEYINYVGAQTSISDNELIYLNQLIEKFYTQS